MNRADRLIDEIVQRSGIPSRKGRRELARELRSHAEDLALEARRDGRSEDEIEKRLQLAFGEPRQAGCNFAWVYRRERAMLRLPALALSAVMIALAVAAATLALQAGVAAGFGRTLGGRHSIAEGLDILATAAVYIGALLLEDLFADWRLARSMALVAALAVAASAAVNSIAPFLILGLVNAIFLRTVQAAFVTRRARVGAAFAWFGVFGALLARGEGWQGSLAPVAASWAAMGLGYALMPELAAWADRSLLGRLERLW